MPRRNPIPRVRSIGVSRGVALIGTTHGSQVLSTAGAYIWSAPPGIVSIVAVAYGRGGSGGTHASGSGGGGGGGYGLATRTVVPGATYTIQVGGISNNGITHILNPRVGTILMRAAGGATASGQAAGAGGSVAVTQADTEFAGASGGTGDATGGGGGGSSAGTAAAGGAGANASGTGGAGGTPPSGAGAGGNGGDNGLNGANGTAPGGGGGGGGAGGTPGVGADGRLTITW